MVALASPASAITHGSADKIAHPEVGAILASRPADDQTWSYCTGTLISPTVLLTAAHCGEHHQKTARVSFASHYQPGAPVYTGRYVPDPRYKDKSDLYDMAVVVFSKPIPGIRPAKLPAAGLLDQLRDDSSLATNTFTPVGYGSLQPAKGRHGWRYTYTDTRYQTSISFKKLTRHWLELSTDPAKGDGSTCYGDSGGPDFLGGPTSDLLVATTISGDDDACKTTNYDYRLDTTSAREFLGKWVTLP